MNLDLNNWDPRTLPGMSGKQAKAKGEAEDLKVGITNLILNDSTTVLVLRDVSITPAIVSEARKFPENVILIDYLALEKGMFLKIYGKNAKNMSFNTDTISRMNSLMIDVGDALQVVSMPTLTADGKLYGTSNVQGDILSKMETVMTNAYDTDLKQVFINHAILDNMDNKFQNDAVSVFIINVPPVSKFLKALSSYTSRTVIVTEDEKMLGAVVLTPDSNAEELVGAITQVTKPGGVEEAQVEEKKARKPRARSTNGEQA